MGLIAHGPLATLAPVVISILSYTVVFQTVTYAQNDGSPKNIDPKVLARDLRAEICDLNYTQTRDFYRQIIREENTNITYPDQSRFPKYLELVNLINCLCVVRPRIKKK